MKNITLKIDGMQCQGCAQILWNAMSRQPGVRTCNVSLQAEQAQLLIDESQTSAQALRQVIERAGYQATVKS